MVKKFKREKLYLKILFANIILSELHWKLKVDLKIHSHMFLK